MNKKRTRALALRDEGARHPFRLTLPREILRAAREEAVIEEAMPASKRWHGEDTQLFVFSFAAFFTAFYLFIF